MIFSFFFLIVWKVRKQFSTQNSGNDNNVFAIKQESRQRKEPQKVKLTNTLQTNTDTAKNAYQREISDKNSYKRVTADDTIDHNILLINWSIMDFVVLY